MPQGSRRHVVLPVSRSITSAAAAGPPPQSATARVRPSVRDGPGDSVPEPFRVTMAAGPGDAGSVTAAPAVRVGPSHCDAPPGLSQAAVTSPAVTPAGRFAT